MATTPEQSGKWNSDLEQKIRLALREIRLGTLTKVIQLDKSEKIRI